MIFTAVFPLEYPGCRCYVSAVIEGVEGFTYYEWVSPKSADHTSWVNSSARGWRKSGGLARNGLIRSGDTWPVGVLLLSMTTSTIKSASLILGLETMMIIEDCAQGTLRCNGRTDKLCGGRDTVGDTRRPIFSSSEPNSLHVCTNPIAELLNTIIAQFLHVRRDRTISPVLTSRYNLLIKICREYSSVIDQMSLTLLVGKFCTRQNLSDGRILTNCFAI